MQYPLIGQPQYGFAPTMPGMAGGGLASLPVRRFQDGGVSTAPRYSYDPVTQRYTRITPEQQANLAVAAQKYDYESGGGDSGVGSPGSSGSTSSGTVGSSGTLGGVAQGVNAAVSNVQSALGPFSMAVPGLGIAGALSNMGVEKSMDVNEEADAALAAANEQANQATVSMGAFGPQVTTAVDISPVTVNPVDVSPIAGLVAMNQAQKAEEQEVSPVDVAMDTVASFADTQDAEAGAANAAAAAATSGNQGGSNQGASNEGVGGYSTEATVGVDANDAPGGGGPSGDGPSSSTSGGGTDTGASDGNWRMGGRVMRYEQGGLAAAQQARSKGRGQDTMLVHMTPKEVGGLQALAMAHGGSLTINPKTGLPEAGFLSAILPMVAGFALGPAGFGLMSSALGAGAVVGGLTGLATGSLKKGLMAGLGAYGGFGLGEGLVSAATPVEAAQTGIVADPSLIDASATQFPTKDMTFGQIPDFGASQTGIVADPSLVNTSATQFPTKDMTFGQTPSFSAPQSTLPDYPVKNVTYGDTGQALGSVAKDTSYAQLPTPPSPTPAPTGFEAAKSGVENIFKPAAEGGAEYRKAFGAALPYGTTIAAGAPLAMAAAEPPPGPTPSISNIRPYKLDISNPSGTPQYTPQDTREREQVRYAYSPQPIYQAAQGGMMSLMRGGSFDDEIGKDDDFAYAPGGKVKRSIRGNPYYKFAHNRKDSSMEAAIEQNFAKGGLPPRFLQGAGDGMSDSIKARIGGVQEARLADGEFVVPADVVSHLGNGSSKAGAKKLYAMMDKIRKARTGRTRQAPEVNPNKYMPA
jgi:hypothetical protein